MMRVTEREKRRAEVIVIGAGLAGLTAARTLVAAGVDVRVLEARNRVGGRTYTAYWPNGTPIDMGGQWIGPGQERIAALAAAMGVTTFPTYDEGANVLLLRSDAAPQGERVIYTTPIPNADPEIAAGVTAALDALDAMAATVPLEAPWTAPLAARWDAQTFAAWIDENVSVPGARAWLTITCAAIFSAEPHDLSLLHVLFYSRSAGGWYPLINTTDGAQERRFHAGAQMVSLRVARELGDRVILNTPVDTVIQDERGIQVLSAGSGWEAERVIVALPPALAGRLQYRPALGGMRDQLTQRMPMGTVIKVQCLYERPFWRESGLTGQATSDTGPVGTTFDNSPHDGSRGVLVGFVEGDEARRLGHLSSDERYAIVVDDLVRYFGSEAANPLAYAEMSWADEEYSRGAYAGYMPTGVWTAFGEELRKPIGRLHWAGTETATVWNGYMDGAVSSGERAAAEVFDALHTSTRRLHAVASS